MDKDFIREHDYCNRYKSYLKDRYPKCKKCDTYFYLDDIDYDFEGKQDEYWVCPCCNSTMKVMVRYSKVKGITFSKGDMNG